MANTIFALILIAQQAGTASHPLVVGEFRSMVKCREAAAAAYVVRGDDQGRFTEHTTHLFICVQKNDG